MAHAHDHTADRRPVRVLTLTISDTRKEADDTSGALLREALTAAGHTVVRHVIVPDEPTRVRDVITRAIDGGEADAVVSTGGTGIAPRDQTYEAVSALLEKTLDGFGEAFRRLSWDEIGPRSMLSRAVGGTYRGALVFALPGSTAAVRLGVERLIIPVLSHAVALLRP
ncbi:MAG: MogA/MoaB family molybdenum cofactor biosynthesis protein [Deltaproteobacteria bacterium]